MTVVRSYRGQPLVALGLVLGGWIAARAMIFDAAAVPPPESAVVPVSIAQAVQDRHLPFAVRSERLPADLPVSSVLAPLAPGWSIEAVPQQGRVPLPVPVGTQDSEPLAPVMSSAGHQIMFLSAMAQLPLPPVIFVPPATPPAPGGETETKAVPLPSFVRTRAPQWSGDAWLLLRGGKSEVAGGAPLASYGASQVGAVLRYRLAPGSAHRPDAYLRASSALEHRDRELAAGLAVRPLARVPVVVAAEVRLSDQRGGQQVRPAAFAYTELPPATLPLGMRGEAYAQAGYVGGRFATGFVDAQARIDRTVARIGPAELRAGGAAWGGAQKGASRADIGPVASIGLAAGRRAAARLDIDWRFRVAGNAAPASGPALTVSAGF